MTKPSGNAINPINAIDATNGVDHEIKHGLDRFDGINVVLMNLINLVSRLDD